MPVASLWCAASHQDAHRRQSSDILVSELANRTLAPLARPAMLSRCLLARTLRRFP